MPADALALFVARASAVMILVMWNVHILALAESESQPPVAPFTNMV